MLQAQQVEELMRYISTLDRPELVDELAHYPARFPVDFTPEFLNTMPVDQLRHIFFALCLQCGRIPHHATQTAA
jgi:hypothetical protein